MIDHYVSFNKSVWYSSFLLTVTPMCANFLFTAGNSIFWMPFVKQRGSLSNFFYNLKVRIGLNHLYNFVLLMIYC